MEISFFFTTFGDYFNTITMSRVFKFISTTIILSFVLALSSCDNDKTTNLTIAVCNSAHPFCYLDSNGEVGGFEVELLNAIADDQGFTVKYVPRTFEWIMGQFEKKIPKFDGAISLITWTTERWKYMEFTHPYFRSGLAVAAKEGSSPINSLEELKGAKVAVNRGTTAAEYSEFMGEEIGFQTISYDNIDEAIKGVTSGECEAIIGEFPMLWYRESVEKKGITTILRFRDQFTFNLAVKKGENYSLIRMFNDGLLNIENNGTYKKIFDKYFPNYPIEN